MQVSARLVRPAPSTARDDHLAAVIAGLRGGPRDRHRGRTARARLRVAARARRVRSLRLRTRQHATPSVHVAVSAPLSRCPGHPVGDRARRAACAAGARRPPADYRTEILRGRTHAGPSAVAHGAGAVADAAHAGRRLAADGRRRLGAGRGTGSTMPGAVRSSSPAWRRRRLAAPAARRRRAVGSRSSSLRAGSGGRAVGAPVGRGRAIDCRPTAR